MKTRVHTRIIAALMTGVPLLSACEGKLLVADDLPSDDLPADGSGGSGMESPACDCASSPELTALSCAGEAPRYGREVFTTADGAIVAFNICDDDDLADCNVTYWDGGSSRVIPNRKVTGLSASGRQLLTTTFEATEFIDLDGMTTTLPLDVFNIGLLSAAGDVAVGVVGNSGGERLARANTTTGELELLGVFPGISAASTTPDASVITGFGFNFEGKAFWPFRWRAEGTELALPGVPESTGLMPQAISADGAAIAGEVVSRGPQGSVSRYFHWSDAAGYVELPESFGRWETWLSSDGRVMLGTLDVDGPDQFFPDGPEDTFAFRWTEETGVVPIAPYPTVALDMSHDGRVILAYVAFDTGTPEPAAEWSNTETYVWDDVNGIRNLPSFIQRLDERGIDRRGWLLAQGLKLSGDGKVLFGRGLCGGTPTLYRLVLSD